MDTVRLNETLTIGSIRDDGESARSRRKADAFASNVFVMCTLALTMQPEAAVRDCHSGDLPLYSAERKRLAVS